MPTTGRLRSETKVKLDDLKLHPRETDDELIGRQADAAYDDESLSDEEIEAIRLSEKEIEAGRVHSLREIMRDLGDDRAIRSLVE